MYAQYSNPVGNRTRVNHWYPETRAALIEVLGEEAAEKFWPRVDGFIGHQIANDWQIRTVEQQRVAELGLAKLIRKAKADATRDKREVEAYVYNNLKIDNLRAQDELREDIKAQRFGTPLVPPDLDAIDDPDLRSLIEDLSTGRRSSKRSETPSPELLDAQRKDHCARIERAHRLASEFTEEQRQQYLDGIIDLEVNSIEKSDPIDRYGDDEDTPTGPWDDAW